MSKEVVKLTKEEISSVAIYNLLYTNDMCTICCMELEPYIKRLNCKEASKIYGALMRRVKEYNHYLYTNVLGESALYLFAEYNTAMDAYLDHRREKYYYALVDALEGHTVLDSEVLAKLEEARSLTEYSIKSIDRNIKDLSSIGANCGTFYSYKLTDVFKVLSNLCDWVFRKEKYINLNENKEALKRFKEIDKALTDVNKIMRAREKAHKYGRSNKREERAA